MFHRLHNLAASVAKNAEDIESNTASLTENTQNIENINTDLSVKTASAIAKNGATLYLNSLRKSGKYVEVNIVIQGITSIGETIYATLPEGYRPSCYKRIIGACSGTNTARFEIFTSGDIKISNTSLSEVGTGHWFELQTSYIVD